MDETAKKRLVGDVEAHLLSNGGFKTVSNDSNASNAVCYSTVKTSLLRETINSFGLKNGCFTDKLLPT